MNLKILNKKNIYNMYGIIIMMMPLIPEILSFGFYSLKQTLFIISTIIISVILLCVAVKEKMKFTFLDVILGIYLLFVGIATLLAKYGVLNAILGKNGRGEGLILIICYSLTFIIFSKGYKYINWILKVGIISSAIVALYSIIEVMLPVNWASPFMFRCIGNMAYSLKRIENVAITTMVNQNFLSSYICLFLPMMAFYYINTGKKTSLYVAILLFSAQIFSTTLGGYITFISMYVLVIIYSFIVSNDKRKVLIRTLFLTLLIILTLYIINYIKDGVYINELGMISTEVNNLIDQNDEFGTGRMNIWKKCFMIINKYKWFGIGPDSLKYEIHKEEYSFISTEVIDKAHSEPLQIALSTGIPSVISYFIFVGIICLLLFKTCIINIRNNEKGLQDENNIYNHMILISILSYLMQSMINISVIQVAPIYWAMLGLGAGIIYDRNEKDNLTKNTN